MPTNLPVIHGTSAANYPFTATYTFLTGVSAWQNGAQQRWPRQPGCLVKFQLPYGQMTQSQKNTLLGSGLVTVAKGRFNTALSLTVGSTTWTNLVQDSDEWTAAEGKTTQYAAPLSISQTITQNLSPGSPGGAFPTLANGAIGMLPYRQKMRFQTVAQRLETGPTYTTAEFAGGITGYPTTGLMGWEFDYSTLTDADTATLVAHFIANWGRAFSFTFTDEDSTSYSKTHYAMDDLAVTYRGVNDSSVKVTLEATF